jgi:hypothetical protein
VGQIVIQIVIFVVPRHVARQAGPIQFLTELGQHAALDLFAALRVDWMRDVGVELNAAIGITDRPIIALPSTALIAIVGP